MRIVSLLASGTELVCALGAGARLVGRSPECDDPSWVTALPALSRPTFDVSGPSDQIDRLVKQKVSAGELGGSRLRTVGSRTGVSLSRPC